MSQSSDIRSRQQAEGSDLLALARPVLFVATFLLAWVGVDPFPNLSDPARIAHWAQGNPLNQIAYLGLGSAVVLTAFLIDRRVFRIYRRPIYWITMGWLGVTTLLSVNPSLGFRRLVLTIVVMALAGLVLALPRNQKQFAGLLGGIICLILFLCYFGVAFMPLRSIHQITDAFIRNEKVGAYVVSNLVGDWRGLFPHKNAAAPMMVLFIFIGLYIARIRNSLLGWTIIAASVVFLYFTHGKTATILLPAVLVMAAAVSRLPGFWPKALVALGGVIALNVIAVGSSYFAPIHDVVALVLPDNATFTDRSVIWQLAMDNIRGHLIFGHGFDTFWNSPQLLYSHYAQTPGNATWAPDAHNAYLDMAIAGGLPGLVFGLYWVLVTPMRDYQTIRQRGGDEALSLLFLRIWLLGIYLSSFESDLFARDNSVWFTTLVAIFGLRSLTMWGVVEPGDSQSVPAQP